MINDIIWWEERNKEKIKISSKFMRYMNVKKSELERKLEVILLKEARERTQSNKGSSTTNGVLRL